MQPGSVLNNVSQNISYVTDNIKVGTDNNDSSKNAEKSFKDILSDTDSDVDNDIGLLKIDDSITFDLDDDISKNKDLSNQDISLIDILLTNFSSVKGENVCKLKENSLNNICVNNVNDNAEILIENSMNLNSENTLEDVEIFNKIFDEGNIVKNNNIDNEFYIEKNSQKNEQENELELCEVSEIITNDTAQYYESFEDSIYKDDTMISDKNTTDEFKTNANTKNDLDKDIDKLGHGTKNNTDHGFDSKINLNRKNSTENKVINTDLENNNEVTESIFGTGVLQGIENNKLGDNFDQKLQNMNIQSKVLNDTKNALVECIKTKDGEFNLYLEPKALGTLKIKVSFKENNSISVVFSATTSQTLDILKQETHDIVNMISSLGFDVNSDSLNFNFSQNNSNLSKNSFAKQNSEGSNRYFESSSGYKKIWVLNDQNVDVLV